MKNFKYSLLLTLLFMGKSYSQDWANLNRFAKENAELGLPEKNEKRVVFIGNSITEGWKNAMPDLFADGYINRGIGGQTTPQMLVRFRADVINLEPEIVVILAGTNDIAQNTGPITLEAIAENIFSMAELAKANGIKVILCSVLPAYDYPWKPGMEPAQKILTLNSMIKKYADRNKIQYVDYHTRLADERNGFKSAFAPDGVHPNESGYRIMAPLVQRAIEKILNK